MDEATLGEPRDAGLGVAVAALDHQLPVVGGELGVDPAGQPPRLATHACTRSGASQDEGSADGPPQLATNS